MRFYKSLCILFLFSQVSIYAQIPFHARVDSITSFFREGEAGMDFCAAIAKIRAAEFRDEGVTIFDELTSEFSPDIIERFRLTAAYMHVKEQLPDSLLKRVAQIWERIPVNPMTDEHENVAYYTSLLLASQHLGSSQKWFNGRGSKENENDAKSFLESWMKVVTEEGQQEFDSPTYGPVFFVSMLLIRQFSTDADLRMKAELMAHWLLADYTHEYVGGQFGGAHAREELFSAMQPIASEMSAIAWLYFGDGMQLYAREQFLATLSDYKPPQAIIDLALSKQKPFEAFEMKRSADRIRGDTTRTRPVMKYTYVDPLYVVGSMKGGLISPREQHSWDVTWTTDSPQSTLFTMQPYAEQEGLTDFLPHSPDRALRAVTKIDPYFATTTKTVGGSPYEDIFQYKNTVIALYDIPDIKRFPFIVGFFPKDVAEFEIDSLKTGWIMINAGDIYLAYYPFKPYALYIENYGQRLFSKGGKNGALVYVVGRNVAGSFKDFKTRIKKTKVDLSDLETKGAVRYTTLSNEKLECAFGGQLSVNGAEKEFDQTMLFESPWITSKRGSGVMMINRTKGKLIIDFRGKSVREE